MEKIKRKKLLDVLEKIKPGIEGKSVVDFIPYFCFSGTDVITYNDKISIQYPFKTKFKVFVEAYTLYKLLSKLKTDNINILESDNKLEVIGKTSKMSLPTIQDNNVSSRIKKVSKSLKKAKWKSVPKNFTTKLLLCSYTASNQESDGTLSYVYVSGKDCISSDNNRTSHAKLDDDMDEMLIKSSEIKNLIKIKPTSYSITKAWLHFKSDDNCIFSIRKITGNFSDFLPFFNFDGKKINLPFEILEGLDLASILTDELDSSVNIKISKGFCFVSVKSDAGESKHKSKIDYKGDDIMFVVNPEFLKEMINHSSSLIIGEDRLKLQTENFSLLTALYN